MKFPFAGKEEGQVLVQVTIAIIVLLAFVSLAVDASMVYSERRNMQNAADAGALAGAYQMCFVDPTRASAEAVAVDYATERNQAETALVDFYPEDDTAIGGLITVTAQITTPTYFARFVGFPEIDVGATAVAACGKAASACGLSPISFHDNIWDDIPCDAKFYVWNDDRVDINDPACQAAPPDLSGDFGYVVSTSDRGWIQFPRPESPYPDEYGCADNCGAQQTKCIVRYDYSGNVEVSIDEGPICLPGESGVQDSVRKEIQDRVDREGPYKSNILLWDRACTADEGQLGTCSGTPYHITGLGCTTILGVSEINACGKNNIKVVLAQKSCDCSTTCGNTDGTPADADDVKAVNLLR